MLNFSSAALIGESSTDLRITLSDSSTDRYAKSTDKGTGRVYVAFRQDPTITDDDRAKVLDLGKFLEGAFKDGGVEIGAPFRAQVRFIEETVMHKPPQKPGGYRQIVGTSVTVYTQIPTTHAEAAKAVVSRLETSIPAFLAAAPK